MSLRNRLTILAKVDNWPPNLFCENDHLPFAESGPVWKNDDGIAIQTAYPKDASID